VGVVSFVTGGGEAGGRGIVAKKGEHSTSNIEHRTLNLERGAERNWREMAGGASFSKKLKRRNSKDAGCGNILL
jgi:hypothetical protein